MLDAIMALNGEARYQDLLREAENERRAPKRRLGIDLLTVLALLGLGIR